MDYGIKYFLKPFHFNLWCALCIWAFLIIIVIGTVHYVILRSDRTKSKSLKRIVILKAFCQIFETLTNQNGDGHNNQGLLGSSARKGKVIATIGTLVLFNAYSGTILSFILIPKIKLPFTNIKGLVKDGTYKLGVPWKRSYGYRVSFFIFKK